MKIRHLKKKKFVAVFRDYVTDWDNYEAVISYNNGWCCSDEWEYDNGLYLEFGTYPFTTNWKQFKQNLKPNYWTGKKNYHIMLYKGKCDYCGKPITFNEFYDMHENICKDCDDKRFMEFAEDEDYE